MYFESKRLILKEEALVINFYKLTSNILCCIKWDVYLYS